jgi:hypothetical protein
MPLLRSPGGVAALAGGGTDAATSCEGSGRGYDAIAVDLAARGRIGLPSYADAVADAVTGRTDVALIAQSMGAFTAPPKCPIPAALTDGSSLETVVASIQAQKYEPGGWVRLF